MKLSFFLLAFSFICLDTFAQLDSSLLRRVDSDTSQKLNMDAIYNRPFLKISKTPVSLGGYISMNYQHLSTDGISDGHEFQLRRMSIFLASSITRHVKFLSELELENDKDEQLEGAGTELEIEYAALDIEFHPLLNLRGGIVLNPIGAFNQNHDDPKWEFTDRPIAMTHMLPEILSSPGFGLYGRHYSHQWMFAYEAYLTNGLDPTIIDNDLNKTYLPHATENKSRLSSSISGMPMFTGKCAFRLNKIGELGLSYMNGVYNEWQQEGVVIDNKRHSRVWDLDFSSNVNRTQTSITGEWAWVHVDLPPNYFEQFGSSQQGGFLDIVQPIYSHSIWGWKDAQLRVALRMEYVDWNRGNFISTGSNKAEDLWSVMPGLSFRPEAQTVIRLNYRWMQQRDILGNPPATTGGFIIGLSSYF